MSDEQKTVTFTVEAIKNPEGKKPGAIKTDSGNWINVWQSEFSQFQKGGKYRAIIYNRPYNDKDQWVVSSPDKGGKIESLSNGNGHAPASPNGSGNGNDYEAQKQEAIYVCGVVNSAINAEQITTPGELSAWTNGAIAAWRTRKMEMRGNGHQEPEPRQPPRHDDLNDEIPF